MTWRSLGRKRRCSRCDEPFFTIAMTLHEEDLLCGACLVDAVETVEIDPEERIGDGSEYQSIAVSEWA